jgi:hypothetical protein
MLITIDDSEFAYAARDTHRIQNLGEGLGNQGELRSEHGWVAD